MLVLKIIDKFLNFIMTVFFLIVIAIAGYALYDVNQVYSEAKLSEDILKYKPDKYVDDGTEKFNLHDLQNEINEDICGWIRVDGTNIDYPILYSSKSSIEYLDKNYKKEYSPGGSIFLDWNNDRFFNDNYTIIYGHNMAERLMFSDIKEFKDEKYFNEHKTGKLYADGETYNILIYTINVLNSNKDIAYRIEQYKNGKNADLIKSFESSAIHKNDISISEEDKLIMLTTCNGVATPERVVLFCKLEKVETAENINEENNSNIDRDEKIKEKEQFNVERRAESRKIQSELAKEEYKAKKNDKFGKKMEELKFYWEQQIHNPRRLALYGCILITLIIYIILCIKLIRSKLKKGMNKGKKINKDINNKNNISNNVKSNRKKTVSKGKHSK